jgi:hypothetical protein
MATMTPDSNSSAIFQEAAAIPAKNLLQAPVLGHCVLRFTYFNNTVHFWGIKDFRQIFLRPFSNTWNLRSITRLLRTNYLYIWILFFQVGNVPIIVPVVPIAATKWVTVPYVSFHISGPMFYSGLSSCLHWQMVQHNPPAKLPFVGIIPGTLVFPLLQKSELPLHHKHAWFGTLFSRIFG